MQPPQTSKIPTSALAEWRTGWALVIAAACGVALGSIQIYATGVFVAPLEAEFGWSRGDISAGLLAPSILGVLFSPVLGMLIDRWGARRIAIPGAIMVCSATAALSLAGPSIHSWWALWVVFGIAALFQKPTIWSTAVSSHFSISRGFALAVMLSGTGLAQACLPTITRLLIDELGWRGAYMTLGAGFAVIVVPVLLVFFHDARFEKGTTVRRTVGAEKGYTPREAIRTRQFWQLALAAFIMTGVIVAFVFHLVPLLSELGLSRANATYVAGIAGICSVIGRLCVGAMLDRLPGPPVGAASVALPIIAAGLLLAFPGSLTMAIVAIIFLGLCIGGEYDSIIYLSTRYFGMRNFGTLFGWVAAALLAGVGLGPWVAGTIHDVTGSYDLFLWLVIPLAALSSLLLGTLGKYPQHEEKA
ncbi:MAG: MFS transporter [Sphingomonadales bacterium]|nr:MAG: MFS transporter [Sphingomonadales bacterium]